MVTDDVAKNKEIYRKCIEFDATTPWYARSKRWRRKRLVTENVTERKNSIVKVTIPLRKPAPQHSNCKSGVGGQTWHRALGTFGPPEKITKFLKKCPTHLQGCTSFKKSTLLTPSQIWKFLIRRAGCGAPSLLLTDACFEAALVGCLPFGRLHVPALRAP